MNAFTAKEYTCFYARVLDEDLPLAVDVVGDMVTSSTITAADVEAEREVILDEIAMHDDDPDDVVTNQFAEQALGRHAAGPADRRHGRVDHVADPARRSRATTGAATRPRTWSSRSPATSTTPPSYAWSARRSRAASFLADPAPGRCRCAAASGPGARATGEIGASTRPIEQANLVLGVPGLARTDERRFALGVLNAALGGGMSSRLFQEVREQRGLAYSVYSYAAQYADAGVFGVYAGCLPGKVDEVLTVVRDELAGSPSDGITDEELDRGKGQLRGGLVLGLEDTGSRMSRIGKAELVYGELLERRRGARPDRRRHPRRRAHRGPRPAQPPETLAVVGPFDDAARA